MGATPLTAPDDDFDRVRFAPSGLLSRRELDHDT
jgi:hypothetical protein